MPSNPERAFWEDTAKRAAHYRDMIRRNVFQIVPPGVTSTADNANAADEWDHVDSLPPPGEGAGGMFSNGCVIARAIDATWLR